MRLGVVDCSKSPGTARVSPASSRTGIVAVQRKKAQENVRRYARLSILYASAIDIWILLRYSIRVGPIDASSTHSVRYFGTTSIMASFFRRSLLLCATTSPLQRAQGSMSSPTFVASSSNGRQALDRFGAMQEQEWQLSTSKLKKSRIRREWRTLDAEKRTKVAEQCLNSICPGPFLAPADYLHSHGHINQTARFASCRKTLAVVNQVSQQVLQSKMNPPR
jgi:hypothetical protein